MSEIFNDLGMDSLRATEVYTLLGLNHQDLKDPQRYQLFKDVTVFLSDKTDLSFWVSRVTQGKNVDKLQQVWEYSKLLVKKDIIDEANSVVNGQISEMELKFDSGRINADDEAKYMELVATSVEQKNSSDYLSEEINLYEN